MDNFDQAHRGLVPIEQVQGEENNRRGDLEQLTQF